MKSDIFGFPTDVITDTPSVRLVGNTTVEILNHKGLKECEEDRVLVNTKIGVVLVKGSKLLIKEFNSECLSVEGRITSISYV